MDKLVAWFDRYKIWIAIIMFLIITLFVDYFYNHRIDSDIKTVKEKLQKKVNEIDSLQAKSDNVDTLFINKSKVYYKKAKIPFKIEKYNPEPDPDFFTAARNLATHCYTE